MKQILSLGAGFDTTFFKLQVTSKRVELIESYSQLIDKVSGAASLSRGKWHLNIWCLTYCHIDHFPFEKRKRRGGVGRQMCQLSREEKGLVYKLLPIDLRDIQKLVDIIAVAYMDPRYDADKLISSSPIVWRNP
ncbi:leucine carboxyl methyltransferase 1 homolog [Juglans microcarpa x Juglans regia]|uniref:leucine carboxyl methyltransferase 1 homolog n=1 Tax=Juglans microcarpa x Juglans regia TaxID=2249226 RepID=UPI001B7E5989|nr:leucine carboxyl methyltransferase 1 homolog [Juglans microcarpa x Juglans regia]XP_040995440.1 leucine carboxyl methyltransferase 1 homolog [Juglans microcarpa x Juglans regia]